MSPKKDQTWDSLDDEDYQEEDKTVTATAYPRKVALIKSSPRPRPRFLTCRFPEHLQEGYSLALQPCRFFSVSPGRDSATHSSMAYLPLRGGVPPSSCYHLARLLKEGAGAFGRNHALQTTMSSSYSTGNHPLLACLLHPSLAPQTRFLRISLLPNHP